MYPTHINTVRWKLRHKCKKVGNIYKRIVVCFEEVFGGTILVRPLQNHLHFSRIFIETFAKVSLADVTLFLRLCMNRHDSGNEKKGLKDRNITEFCAELREIYDFFLFGISISYNLTLFQNPIIWILILYPERLLEISNNFKTSKNMHIPYGPL